MFTLVVYNMKNRSGQGHHIVKSFQNGTALLTTLHHILSLLVSSSTLSAMSLI